MVMRDAAVALARANYRVFTCVEGGKQPRVKTFYDVASSDPEVVAAMWTNPATGESENWNIGVDCSDFIAIDIDMKNGVDGLASYLALGLPLDTRMAKTTSGGYHALFSGPPKGLSVGKLGPGLDVRSFHGYILGVGSIINGIEYVWDNDCPVLPAPPHLLAKLDEPRERSNNLAATELDTEFAEARVAKYLREEAPPAIEGAGGDAATFRVLCIAKDMGVSQTLLLDLAVEHYNPRCSPPWSIEELEAKVDNVFLYALSAAGGQSPAVDFGGIEEIPAPRYVQPVPSDRRWQQHGDALNLDATWLFYEMLPQTGVCVLAGPSQGGKTFVLMHLARALGASKPFFGTTPDERGGTIILTGEGRRSMLARMEALEEDDRLPIVSGDIDNLSVPGALDALAADLRAKMDGMALQFGVPVRLVAIDTLSASGLLRDEDANSEAGVAMKALSKLSEMLNVLVVVTHHPPKDGKGLRGASAIFNDVDVVIEIVREKTNSIRELSITKARDAQQRSLGVFTLIPVRLGTDSRGRVVTSCHVSDAPPTGKDLTQVPKHVDVLIESVEWALVGDSDMIEGRQCVDVDIVRDVFKDRFGGSKDASNFRKKWEAVLTFGIESGALAIIPHAGRKYLAMPSFSVSAAPPS